MTGYRVNLEANFIQYDFEKGVLLNNSYWTMPISLKNTLRHKNITVI